MITQCLVCLKECREIYSCICLTRVKMYFVSAEVLRFYPSSQLVEIFGGVRILQGGSNMTGTICV